MPRTRASPSPTASPRHPLADRASPSTPTKIVAPVTAALTSHGARRDPPGDRVAAEVHDREGQGHPAQGPDLDLHDLLPRQRWRPGQQHPARRAHPQRHLRPAGRHVQPQRCPRPAHARRRATSRAASSRTAASARTTAVASRRCRRPCSTRPSSRGSSSRSTWPTGSTSRATPRAARRRSPTPYPDNRWVNTTDGGIHIRATSIGWSGDRGVLRDQEVGRHGDQEPAAQHRPAQEDHRRLAGLHHPGPDPGLRRHGDPDLQAERQQPCGPQAFNTHYNPEDDVTCTHPDAK